MCALRQIKVLLNTDWEYVVISGHVTKWQPHHAVRHAIAANLMLHENITSLSCIEQKLLPIIVFLISRNANFEIFAKN